MCGANKIDFVAERYAMVLNPSETLLYLAGTVSNTKTIFGMDATTGLYTNGYEL